MEIYSRHFRKEGMAEIYNLLRKEYAREIKLKPLYDENWEKLKMFVESGDLSDINQAIALSETLDDRYIASIFAYVIGQAQKEDFLWALSEWDSDTRRGEYYLHLWNVIDQTESSGRVDYFAGWYINGKEATDMEVYYASLKYLKIDEDQVILGVINPERKKFLISMDGEVLPKNTIEASCYCRSVVAPNAVMDIELVLESVDEIDVRNALTYTDTYPDEEKGEYIQRGLLYLELEDFEDSAILPIGKKPIVEAVGALSYVGEDGSALPLEQSAGITIRFEFPKDFEMEIHWN